MKLKENFEEKEQMRNNRISSVKAQALLLEWNDKNKINPEVKRTMMLAAKPFQSNFIMRTQVQSHFSSEHNTPRSEIKQAFSSYSRAYETIQQKIKR